jgi:hypothetical protein
VQIVNQSFSDLVELIVDGIPSDLKPEFITLVFDCIELSAIRSGSLSRVVVEQHNACYFVI